MGVTETFMDGATFQIPLRPDTPRSVHRDLALSARLWDTVIVTSRHLPLGTVTAAQVKALAMFSGVLLEIGEDGSLIGDGLEWWLGNSGDGGSLHVGVDGTHTGKDFEQHLDDEVFGASNVIANGLTKGSVDNDGTTFSFKEEGGDTPREILDTLCRVAPGGPNSWRVSPAGVLDADAASSLWPTTTVPTVMFANQPGRGVGAKDPVVGFGADLRVRGRNGREVRTGVYVDWQDGVDNGISTPSLPAAYTSYDGGTPRVRHYEDWRPKRPKPATERWRKVAAWRIASEARANSLAAAEANERSSDRPEITAEIDLRHPHRFDLTPGNTVYLHDVAQGLYDTANEVYHRGVPTHPTTGRVDSIDWPILRGYGVYVSSWAGGVETLTDFTHHADPEEGPTVVQIGTRSRFPIARVRTRTLTRRHRRQVRRRAHYEARLEKFARSGYFR